MQFFWHDIQFCAPPIQRLWSKTSTLRMRASIAESTCSNVQQVEIDLLCHGLFSTSSLFCFVSLAFCELQNAVVQNKKTKENTAVMQQKKSCNMKTLSLGHKATIMLYYNIRHVKHSDVEI